MKIEFILRWFCSTIPAFYRHLLVNFKLLWVVLLVCQFSSQHQFSRVHLSRIYFASYLPIYQLVYNESNSQVHLSALAKYYNFPAGYIYYEHFILSFDICETLLIIFDARKRCRGPPSFLLPAEKRPGSKKKPYFRPTSRVTGRCYKCRVLEKFILFCNNSFQINKFLFLRGVGQCTLEKITSP